MMTDKKLNPEVIKFTEIDSTNNEAIRLINKKKSYPYWILADKQTAGKGRKNRYWDSLNGNFMGTYVFKINVEKKILPHLAFVSALSIHDTIKKFIPNDEIIKLKWPNDIIINKSKCGGVLIENIFSDNQINHIIAVGIGVNLTKSPLKTSFPSSNIFDETKIVINPEDFLKELNINIIKKIDLWDFGSNYKKILEEWLKKAFLLNKEISVSLPNGKKEKGIFSSIDDQGGLVLTTEKNCNKIFYAAEIFEGL
ncbi:MAG: biotin--[acetyl-CoA-carboxylase] ligase [Rhizobiales bacterium TMED168]|nr:MAG: biotin--[acetyl-CoA-carboxylase] ligase [Rhizobiales bacterium TMED168]